MKNTEINTNIKDKNAINASASDATSEKITKIYFVRHGQSLGNAERIYLGHTDWDLSELGKEQAQYTATALKDEKIDVIYSSDLLRAFNTAVPHAKMRNMTVIPSKNLREVYVGEWEGRKVDEIMVEYQQEFCVEWREHFGTFRCPGGESVPEVAERIYNEVKRIAEKHMGETILITSHAAAIRAFWGKISGIKPEDLAAALPFPTNASYSVLYYKDGELVPESYSVDSHMPIVTKIT